MRKKKWERKRMKNYTRGTVKTKKNENDSEKEKKTFRSNS